MIIQPQIIDKLKALNSPAIIAISGFGGAGKSSAANQIGKLLDAPVVCIDSFIRKDKPKEYSNWEVMDFNRLISDVIKPFKEGKNPVTFIPSRWEDGVILSEVALNHNGVLVIEGVGLLQPTLMPYYSYSIWIDTEAEEAFRRGKKRDREEYNNPHDELWDGLWKENDIQFYEKNNPHKLADVVLDNK